MIAWLKYTFGNFFSNKLSKEGTHRRIWNLLFALIMFLVLLTSFLSSGYSFSYWTHYENSTSFQEFAYNTFYNDDSNSRVNIQTKKVNDKTYATAYFGTNKVNIAIINTFENESDSKYKVNDYNLIVDTRDSSSTFVNFTVKYFNRNDETDTISADEFRNLSSNNEYIGTLDVTNELATYTDEDIITYTSWLNVYTSSLATTHDYVSEWNEIKLLNKDSKIFKDKTYSLYNRAYYCLNITPTIQTYYQSTYAILDETNNYKYKNYVIITDNWCVISFTTEKGINVTFDGYYNNFNDGYVLCTEHTNTKDIVMENVDNFFATVFDSISSVKALYMGVTVFRFYPYIILALLILAAFVFLSCKVKAREYALSYLDGLKITSGYLIISSLIAGLVGFIASFMTSQQISFAIASWGTLAILMLRTLLFVVFEEVSIKKEAEMVKINKALYGEDYVEEKPKQTKKNSDDEFKMGKM